MRYFFESLKLGVAQAVPAVSSSVMMIENSRINKVFWGLVYSCAVKKKQSGKSSAATTGFSLNNPNRALPLPLICA